LGCNEELLLNNCFLYFEEVGAVGKNIEVEEQ